MFLIKLFHVILLINVFRMIDSSYRRIKDGKSTNVSMQYMVYLTKAEKSPTLYDAWICGGSIVTEDFIVTSAACVQDVQFMYAIAGYRKYVNGIDIYNDPCTSDTKRKVVFVCVPRSYDFAYDKVEKWAFIDIAVVKVDYPYDFKTDYPHSGCSWVPNKIDINYDVKYQAPNTDAMILGWGHTLKWRQPGDKKDYNQKTLKYSPILLMDKTVCKNLYGRTPLPPIIDRYMLCAMDEGNINDKGELIRTPKPDGDGCAPEFRRAGGACEVQNEKPEGQMPINYLDNEQRAGKLNTTTTSDYKPFIQTIEQNNNNRSGNEETITFEDIILNLRRTENINIAQRRAGICQNDHGGPLVTWVGHRHYLIGVASVFRLDNLFNCVGPYLFTSTQCNGAFLDCVLNNGARNQTGNQTLRRFCNLPPEKKGFAIIERNVSWRNHPDGPARNELADDL